MRDRGRDGVNAHGFVRATRGVHIIAGMPLADAGKKLRSAGVDAKRVRGDRLEGGSDCIKGVIGVGLGAGDPVPFDVLPELVPFDPTEAIELDVRGTLLRVVDRDTLIRLKLKASSIKDLYDIAILANLHPEWGDRAIALALEHGADLARRMADLLQEPRVRAQARDLQRQDSALAAFARRKSNPPGKKAPRRRGPR
jgi:hypothetical protein